MSPKKRGGYSGAYRDSKDRIRPITPRKRSKAKTGVPIAMKARPRSRTNTGRLPKGASMSDIITIEGVSKSRRAWLTDISLDTKTTYVEPGRDWAMDHNRTDVIDIDDPLAQRRRKRLRTGKDRRTRTAKKAPKKPPKSKKKEGVGTVEYDGAVWKWDYQRKDWMLANFGGTLKGKTGQKKKEKEVTKGPQMKTELSGADKSRLKRAELWNERLKKTGMRDPDNPNKTLSPDHPLTKARIDRNNADIAELKGEINLTEYRTRINRIEKREKILKQKKSKPPKTYYGEHMVGDRKTYAVLQGFYPDSVYYNFDLSSVRSNQEWRAFLTKHKFKKVGGPDPDAKGERGRVPRNIYRNQDGIILVTSSESRVRMMVPDTKKGGMKTVPTSEHNLGYVRFELSKSKRDKIKPILKDFRGPRALTFERAKGQGTTDYQGADLGGIATYVKEENPNTDHAFYI